MLYMHITKQPGLFSIHCALLVLLAPLVALAQPAKGSEVNFAGSALHFGYQEFDDAGKLLDREDGFIPGMKLGLSHTSGKWVVAGDFSFHGGDVIYTGQTNSGIPISTDTKQNIADIAIRTEYWINNPHSLNFALYFGAGYHYWNRNIQPAVTSGGAPVSGLLEIYTWWTGFLGLKAEIYQSDSSRWLLDARLVQTIKPEIAIDFNGQYENTSLALGEKLGVRLSLPSSYPINQTTRLSIEPFAETYELGRSNTGTLANNGIPVGTVFEPYSKTINYGLSVGISQYF